MGSNGFELAEFSLLGMIKIPAQLQIQPEIGGHSKEFRQP